MLSGRLEHVLSGHTGRLNAVRISPNNKTVITVADDFTARVYDLQSGDCRSVLNQAKAHCGILNLKEECSIGDAQF